MFDDVLPSGSNEVLAFHGTSEANVKSIIAEGFRRDYNTTSAYGRGAYFAKNAEYSMSPRYAQPSTNSATGEEICYLLIARILLGESCVGAQDQRLPDRKPAGNGALYESMVNSVASPTIYVLGSGSDDNSYPEILLQVRKTTSRFPAQYALSSLYVCLALVGCC